MLDEFLKTLYLIFFVAVNVSEQGVLPKSGLLKPYKNDLQEGGDMEVVIPPDCFEMCDEAGCVIYCPEPARGVKRCTAKSPLNKRFCCSTDGPIAPIFNLPPRPVGTLPPDPLIPTYPSLLKPQKKLPGLTPLLDSKLTEIKNNLNKLKSLRTNLFRRKKSEGQNYIKSNPCDENHQSTSIEEREKEKCRDPVHLTDPSVLLPKPIKNVKEIILPKYDQKEISTSEIDSITNPESDSDLDEDHLNFKTSTRILDQNNLQIQSLKTRKYLEPDTAFQTSEHILYNINNNDPEDSTAILHPSSHINTLLNSKEGNNISLLLPEIKNVHESTTNNNEIISVTESLPLAFQSDPHVVEPIYTEDSTPLKKYEQTFLNDATINKLNYVNSRTYSQEDEPKLSNKTAQENTINLINEEKTKLPIQNESEYENNEYKTVYSKDLLDAPLHSKFINTESITNEQKQFNKPENVIMGTVHDNDSTMINVPTNADENILVNVPKSNIPENISNEFEALYFDDNVAGREKLLIPLSQVLGNVKSHNTQIKEIHSQVTDGQETQGYQNFQPYRSNDQQNLDSEIGEKHPQQTENIWLDYLPIEPSKKKELSSHDTTYYEEHPRDIGTKDAHDEESNIAYLQKTYEGKRGVKHDVENIEYTILKEEPHSVPKDAKFIADDPLLKHSNNDNKKKSESQEVTDKSDTAYTTRPLISESITDDVNLYSKITDEQSVESGDVYGLENDGRRRVELTRLPNNLKSNTEVPLFKYSISNYEKNSEHKIVDYNSHTGEYIHSPIAELINDEARLHTDIDGEQIIEPSEANVVENKKNSIETFSRMNGEHEYEDNIVKLDSEKKIKQLKLESINDGKNSYATIGTLHSAVANDDYGVKNDKKYFGTSEMSDEVPRSFLQGELPFAKIEDILFNFSKSNKKDKVNVYSDIVGEQSVLHGDIIGVDNKRDIMETFGKNNEERGNLRQNVKPLGEYPMFNIPTRSNKEDTHKKEVISNSVSPPTISLLPPQISKSINDEVNVYSETYGNQPVMPSDINGVENITDAIETFRRQSEEHGSHRQDLNLISEHPLFNIPARSNNEDSEEKHVISNSDNLLSISLLPPQISESINDKVNLYNDMDRDQSVLPIDAIGEGNQSDVTHTSGRNSGEQGSLGENDELITEHPLFNIPPRSNEEDTMEKHVISNPDTPSTISPLPQISESINDEINVYNDMDRDQSVLPIDAMGVNNLSDVTHTSVKYSGEHGSLGQDAELITEHPLFNIPTRSNEEDTMQKHVISNSDTPSNITPLPSQTSESINYDINDYNDMDRDQSVLPIDAMGVDNLSDVTHTSVKYSGEHGSLGQDAELITEHPLFNIPTRSNEEDTMQKHVISNSDTPSTISPLPPQISESINDDINVYNDMDRDQSVLPIDAMGVNNLSDVTHTSVKYSGEHGSLGQDAELITEHPLFNIPTRSNEEDTMQKHVISNSDTPSTIRPLPPQISESINDDINVYNDMDRDQSVLPIDAMGVNNLSDVTHTSVKYSGEHGSLGQDAELITEHPLFNIPTRSNEEDTMQKHVISNSDTPSNITPLPSQTSESINYDINDYNDMDRDQSVLPIDAMGVDNLSDVTHTSGKHSGEHGSLGQEAELITEHPLFNIPTRINEEDTMQEHVISNSDTPSNITPLPSQTSESINYDINVYNDMDRDQPVLPVDAMDRDQSVLPIDAMGVDNLSDVTHTSGKHSKEHGSLRQDVELITEHPLFNIPTRSNEEDTMQKHVISNSDTPSNITPLPSQTSESINYDINVYNDMDRDQPVLPVDAMDRDQSVLPIDAMGVDNLSDVTHTSGKHSKEHGSLRQDVELITEHPLFNIPTRSNEEDTLQKHVISNSNTPSTISPLPLQISESINDKVNVLSDIDRGQSGLYSDSEVKNFRDITEAAGEHSGEHVNFIQDVYRISDHPSFDIPSRINKEDAEKILEIFNSNSLTATGPQPTQISFKGRLNLHSATDEQHTSVPSDDFGLENYRDTNETSSRISGKHTNLSPNLKYISDYSLYNIPNHSNKIKYENEHASDKLNSAPYDRVIDQPVLPSNIYGEKNNSDTIEYSGFSQNIRSTRGQSLLKVSNSSNIENTLTEDEHDKSEIAHIINPQMSESYNDVGEILYGTLHGEKTGLHSDDYHVENHQNTFGTSDRHSGEYTSLSHDVNPIINYPILNFLNSGTKNNYMNEEVIDKSYASSLPSLISELNNDKVNFSDVNEEQFIMPSDFFGVENKRNTIEKFARESEKPARFSQIVNPVNELPLFNIPNRSNKNNSNNEDSFNKWNIPPTISQLISDSSNDKEDLYSTIVGDQAITNEKNFITDKYFIPMGNIHKEETDFKIPKISPNMYPQKRGISKDEDEISNQFISRSNVEKLKIERQNEQQDLSVVHNPTNNEVHSNTHIEQPASSGFGVTSVKNRGQDVSFDSSDRKKVDEEDQNVFSSYNNAPLLNALEGIPSINVEESIKYSPEIDDHTYGSSYLNFYNKLYEFNNSTNSNNSQGTTNNEYLNKSVFMEKINDHEENADVESFQFSQLPKNVDTTRKSESEAYNLSMSHMDDVRPDIIVTDLTQDINVNNQEYLKNENVLNNVHTKKLEANIHDEDSLVNIPVLNKPVESETCSCKSESSTFNFPEESSRGLLIGNLINRMNPRSPIHIFIDGDGGIITPERVSFPSKSKLSNTKIDHVISERNIESPKKENPYDFVNGQYVRMGDNEYNNLNENNNQELLEPRSAPKHLSYETSPEHLLTPELRESITSDGISTFQNQQQIKNQGPYISQPNEFYTNHPSSSETGYYTPVPIYIYIRSK